MQKKVRLSPPALWVFASFLRKKVEVDNVRSVSLPPADFQIQPFLTRETASVKIVRGWLYKRASASDRGAFESWLGV